MDTFGAILDKAGRVPLMAILSLVPLMGSANQYWSKTTLSFAHFPSSMTSPESNKKTTWHHCTYIFEGKATDQGKPCAKASVFARVDAPQGEIFNGTVSEPDGSFAIEIPVEAIDNKPVHFFIEASAPNLKRVEMSGQNVVAPDNESVTIVSSLALQPSYR
jgi:hypothetical protein